MEIKTVGIASDHAGYPLKKFVIKYLEEHGYPYKDYGTYSDLSCDYSDFGHALAEGIESGEVYPGIGICGREFCCKGHLQDFQPVSIKMAKEQGLSLNPAKISGCCGRLMCCLKYEQNVYEELLRITPKMGALVVMKDGTHAKVCETNPLTGDLKVLPDKSDVPVKTNRSEVTLLRDGKIKVNQAERKALKSLEDQ